MEDKSLLAITPKSLQSYDVISAAFFCLKFFKINKESFVGLIG
jgi:hypothetical protein